MTFDWVEYLELARELVKQGSISSPLQEALLRSAISRAYYCAYHTARNFMRRQGGLPSSYFGSHEDVIRWYDSQPRAYRAVGNKLERLKDRRVKADYHRVLAPNMTGALQFATETLNDVDMLLVMIKKLDQGGNP